jgi:hypothetical protein
MKVIEKGEDVGRSLDGLWWRHLVQKWCILPSWDLEIDKITMRSRVLFIRLLPRLLAARVD